MTTTLTVGTAQTYPSISAAIGSIGPWIDDYVIEVYNNINDNVVMTVPTTGVNTLTIKGVGGKHTWSSSSTVFSTGLTIHLTVENLIVHHTGTSRAIYCNPNPASITIKKCFLKSNGFALFLNRSGNYDLNITNSILENTVKLDQSAGGTWNILNNVFYRSNSFSNANITSTFTGTLNMVNNIFVNNLPAAKFLDFNSNPSGFSNNLYYNSLGFYSWDFPSPYTSTTQWLTKEPTALFGDPLFVSYPSDLQLQQSSPAVNTGINTGLVDDHVGLSRPQGVAYDIGAYELFIPPNVKLSIGNAVLNPVTTIPYFN